MPLVLAMGVGIALLDLFLCSLLPSFTLGHPSLFRRWDRVSRATVAADTGT